MAMDDFVRALSELQSHTPQAITDNAEQVMETEIDSANAMVINTDGVTTSFGSHGIRDRLEADTESESDDSDRRPTRARRSRANSQYIVPHPDWQGIPTAPPSPSVRRNASHVDISALVDNWHSGPANQTHMYRHPNPSML